MQNKNIEIKKEVGKFLMTFDQENNLPEIVDDVEQPQVDIVFPVVSTTIFATTLAFLLLNTTQDVVTGILGVILTIMLTGLWFMSSLTLSIFMRSLKWNKQLFLQQTKNSKELGQRYERWRINAIELENSVNLQLIKYTPMDSRYDIPEYYPELDREQEFSPEQHIEAIETLAAWKEEAKEKEEKARQNYNRKQEMLLTASQMQKELEENI